MHAVGLIDCLGSKEKVWRFACFLCGRPYDSTCQHDGPILNDRHLNTCSAFADAKDVAGGTEGLSTHFPEVAICCGMWDVVEYKVVARSFVQLRLVQEGASPLSLCGKYYREILDAYLDFQTMTGGSAQD